MGYETLVVWNRGIDLAVESRKIARTFPKFEMFALTAQVCDSGDSVPSNIAEAHGRSGKADKLRFLGYAMGSIYELHTRLIIARRSEYNVPQPVFELLEEVKGLLRNYTRYIEKTGGK